MKEFSIHVVTDGDFTKENQICSVRYNDDGTRDLYVPGLVEFPPFMEEDGWVGRADECTDLESQQALKTGLEGSNPSLTAITSEEK